MTKTGRLGSHKIVTQDFSNLSTFQLARATGMQIGKLRQMPTPQGRFYFCDLNGKTMLASAARMVVIAEIEKRRMNAGLPI
jgi:hypothetical protein